MTIKLFSALIHAEEYIETGNGFDLATFQSMMADPDIKELRADLEAQALLPVKR